MVDPRFNPEDGSPNGLIINDPTSLTRYVASQLESVAAPSLEGHGSPPPKLEETEHPNMEFVDEDLLHHFNEDPLRVNSFRC